MYRDRTSGPKAAHCPVLPTDLTPERPKTLQSWTCYNRPRTKCRLWLKFDTCYRPKHTKSAQKTLVDWQLRYFFHKPLRSPRLLFQEEGLNEQGLPTTTRRCYIKVGGTLKSMMNMRTSLCITWKEMRVEMFISPALEARVILKMKIIFFK